MGKKKLEEGEDEVGDSDLELDEGGAILDADEEWTEREDNEKKPTAKKQKLTHEPPSEEVRAPARQVYVSGIRKATAQELRDFFMSSGAVIEMTDRFGRSKNTYAREVVYCTFKKDKAVQKAIAQSGQLLQGRALRIAMNTEQVKQQKQAEGSQRIFVGNLPLDVTPVATFVPTEEASAGGNGLGLAKDSDLRTAQRAEYELQACRI
eukprot:gene3429-4309_t